MKITAEEARKISHLNSINSVLDKIYTAIREKCEEKKDNFHIFWYEGIPFHAKSQLMADGFIVADCSDRDGIIYKISWESREI